MDFSFPLAPKFYNYIIGSILPVNQKSLFTMTGSIRSGTQSHKSTSSRGSSRSSLSERRARLKQLMITKIEEIHRKHGFVI